MLVVLSARGEPFGIETLLQSIEQLIEGEFHAGGVENAETLAQDAHRFRTNRPAVLSAPEAPRAEGIRRPGSLLPCPGRGMGTRTPRDSIHDCVEVHDVRDRVVSGQHVRPVLAVQPVEELIQAEGEIFAAQGMPQVHLSLGIESPTHPVEHSAEFGAHTAESLVVDGFSCS